MAKADAKFTIVLQELFGPLSMRALEEDQYVRQASLTGTCNAARCCFACHTSDPACHCWLSGGQQLSGAAEHTTSWVLHVASCPQLCVALSSCAHSCLLHQLADQASCQAIHVLCTHAAC